MFLSGTDNFIVEIPGRKTYVDAKAWAISQGGRLPTHAEVRKWIAEKVGKASYVESEWSGGLLNGGYDANPLRNVKGKVWIPVSDAHKYTYIGTGVAYGDYASTGCKNCYTGMPLPADWDYCAKASDPKTPVLK